MAPGTYILDENGNPKAVDAVTWADSLEKADRKLAQDSIGSLRVSTVFLGVDLNFSDKGPPILWETKVSDLPDDEEVVEQYSSRADALEGHKRICDEMRARSNAT